MEYHKPVLYDETIENIIRNKKSVYVDCTLGGGGHTEGILENSTSDSIVIAIDQDKEAIEFAKKRLEKYSDRVRIFRDNFRNLDTVIYLAGYNKVDGILMDIGVSSKQFDDPTRGFSYKYEAKLDMRMSDELEITAHDIVNKFTEKEIADILYKYGEEPKSRRIAKKIVEQRQVKKIETTTELADLVIRSIGKSMKKHPAKRTFQALRIFVNKELEVLTEALDKSLDLLNEGGRLLVITFHSLEDRIVKEKFREFENPCKCPPEIPICVCGKVGKGKVITRKPIIAKEKEQPNETPRTGHGPLDAIHERAREEEDEWLHGVGIGGASVVRWRKTSSRPAPSMLLKVRNSARVPSATLTPFARMMTRSQSFSAVSRRWVEIRIEEPDSLAR